MTSAADTFELLAAQLADPETHWSLGTFGAIAEFMRDPDEAVALARGPTHLSAVTGRGAIRLELPADVCPVASESATGEGWNHRIALCLPADRCAMARRAVLTELGRDGASLRPHDRDATLFDLGLDLLQVDACIRVSDGEVIERLRSCAGRAVFEPGNPAMGIILAAAPHRVFCSRLGRIEVFQPIPPPDGKSPQGPHTHVLPKLLQHKRTHPATEPVPDDLVPCAHLYPAHPAKDALGRSRPFDQNRHAAFQRMLSTFGDPETLALKRRVTAAVIAGESPSGVAVANDRFARASVRVALHQLQASHGPVPALAAWLAAYGRPDQTAAEH